MKRNSLICVFVLLLACAPGCTNLDVAGMFLLQDSGNSDRVVAGSLDAVALSTQNALGQIGLVASTTRKGDQVRIATRTPNGTKFTLALISEKSSAGEKTRIKVEWDGAKDEQTSLQVLARIDAPAEKK